MHYNELEKDRLNIKKINKERSKKGMGPLPYYAAKGFHDNIESGEQKLAWQKKVDKLRNERWLAKHFGKKGHHGKVVKKGTIHQDGIKLPKLDLRMKL